MEDWIAYLMQAAPFLIIVAFWVFMMRQMQGGTSLKSARRRGVVSALDQVLIESERRLSEAKERVSVRVLLANNQTAEGRLVWASSQFIKCEGVGGGSQAVIPKTSIMKIESLAQ